MYIAVAVYPTLRETRLSSASGGKMLYRRACCLAREQAVHDLGHFQRRVGDGNAFA